MDEGMFNGKPEFLTIKDFSEATGLTKGYLRQLARDNELPAIHISKRRWLIPKVQFIEWMMRGRDESRQSNNPGANNKLDSNTTSKDSGGQS